MLVRNNVGLFEQALGDNNPRTPEPGWEDMVGKDQRFGDSIAISSLIKGYFKQHMWTNMS